MATQPPTAPAGMITVYLDGWQVLSETRVFSVIRQASAAAERGRDAARSANARLGLLLLALRGHVRRTHDPRATTDGAWGTHLERLGLKRQTAWRVVEAAIKFGDIDGTKVADSAVIAELAHGCWPESFTGTVKSWPAERSAWLEGRSKARAAARLARDGEGKTDPVRAEAVRAIAEMFSKHPLWAPVIQRELESQGLAKDEAAELAEAMQTVGRYAARLTGDKQTGGAAVRGALTA